MEFKSFVKLQLTHSYSFLKYLKWIKNEEKMSEWDLVSDKQMMQEEQPLQVGFSYDHLLLLYPVYLGLESPIMIPSLCNPLAVVPHTMTFGFFFLICSPKLCCRLPGVPVLEMIQNM
jgi:hypothetical protein